MADAGGAPLAPPARRLVLPQGGEVQVTHVVAGGPTGSAGAFAFVPETAVAPGALFVLAEGTSEPVADAFARRVHEALLAEQGVAASRLIRAVVTGCRAVERRVARHSDLALFGCTALLLESTLQRYAYVSQLPPCQAYVWDGTELTLLPEEPMLGAGQPGGAARSCEVEVDLNRVPLRAGTTLLLAPGALGARLTAAGARDLLRLPIGAAAGELRRLLRSTGPGAEEAILVRFPEPERSPRVRIFEVPVDSSGRRLPEDEAEGTTRAPPPALHKWGLARERGALNGWLDDVAERVTGQGKGYSARRPLTRRAALVAAGVAGVPLALWWLEARQRAAREASLAASQPAGPAAAPPPVLAGRTVLQGSAPFRAFVPAGQGGGLILDAADRLWRLEGQGAVPQPLTRFGAPPAGGASFLSQREGTLLWLDGRRTLWTWRDGETEARPVALRDAAGWRRPVAMVVSGASLFVVDAGDGAAPGQVWRFAAGAGGSFESAPQPWVQGDTTFLRTATACVADGDVWIGREDGTIVRLVNGRAEPFAAARLDVPIGLASAVATAPGSRSLYILDGTGRRLVQLSKGGLFEAQVPDAVAASDPPRGLWVDEPARRALILTEQRLQEVALPALPPGQAGR